MIGSGVAGLTAAYVLQREADVTLYEAADRLGGHADTHDLVGADGVLRNVDTGFIVHNLKTYPLLRRLFTELGVATQESDMSMSISCGGCGLEYAGGRGVSGLLPSGRAVRNPRYLRMLGEVVRFHRRAHALLAGDDDELTVREFLARGSFSPYFQAHFMTPVIAAVWSTAPTQAGDYPARYLFSFLANHGMLQVTGSPAWYTVTGGSARYVEQAAKSLTAVETATPIRAVSRVGGGVEVRDDADGREHFDAAVVATHPHQALAMLQRPHGGRAGAARRHRLHRQPDPAAHRHLGAAGDAAGRRVLELLAALVPRGAHRGAGQLRHEPAAAPRRATDLRGLAERRAARRSGAGAGPDGLRAPRLHDRVGRGAAAAARAQRRHAGLRRRLPRLGLPRGRLPGRRRGRRVAGGRVVSGAALYDVEIAHVRSEPVRHDVRHRSYLWFVDLDELPDHGPLARFEARDHLGDPQRSLRQNLEAFLAEHGIDLHGGRVTMLANARSLGYVFNPLSLYWCHDPDGELVCVVAEVHNTYGQRHRYLLRPDDAGRVDTAKQFYVSPFYPVDGYYRMSLPEPGERLAVTVTLHREGERPFTASVRGVRRPAGRRAVLAAALRHPFETWLVRGLITAHGLRLWRKGLPVQPRPPHPSTDPAGRPRRRHHQ